MEQKENNAGCDRQATDRQQTDNRRTTDKWKHETEFFAFKDS